MIKSISDIWEMSRTISLSKDFFFTDLVCRRILDVVNETQQTVNHIRVDIGFNKCRLLLAEQLPVGVRQVNNAGIVFHSIIPF